MADRIRVLYVDDTVTATAFYPELLADHGFEVEVAATPDDGLGRLVDGQFDCVLSDLEMPETDGFEFLSMVRADHPQLPFILFTSHESAETVAVAFERGVTDFVPKSHCSVSSALLTHRIEQAVQ